MVKRPSLLDGLKSLAAIFTTLPDPGARSKTFYNPGEKPAARRVRFLATEKQVQAKQARRVPRSTRNRALTAFEMAPTGRQWTKLRKKLRKAGKPVRLRPVQPPHMNAAPRWAR